jgi:excisionase family DNA binding protein
MTRQEAADYLRVQPRTVDRMVRERKLTRFVLEHGQHPRFRRAEVASLIVLDDHVGAMDRVARMRKPTEKSLAARGHRPGTAAAPEPAPAGEATGAALSTDTVRQDEGSAR